MGEDSVGIRGLPMLRIDREDYFVDLRLREFRTVAASIRVIEFISFASDRGRRMLEQRAASECRRCKRLPGLCLSEGGWEWRSGVGM